MRAAQSGTYVYKNTHPHEWPDGSRTIEAGVSCDGSDHGRVAA